MKKFLSIILCLTFILSCFAGCARSETKETEPETETEPKENPASDFVYRLNSEQTSVLIEKYIGESEDVVIPSYIDDLPVLFLNGVPSKNNPTAVAEGVFEGTNVRSVVIPKEIVKIGYKCFKDCKNLETITITADSPMKFIGGCAFENCVNLKEIDLSSTKVKEIGGSAFSECSNLKSVVFSNTLEIIKENAFYKCTSLTEADLPESLTVIEGGAFGDCTSLKKVVIPTKLNLTSLSQSMIYHTPNLEKIIFREGRTSIKGYALVQADSKTEIIVPASVTEFSPLPFIFYSPAQVTITFLGDAPAIVDDTDGTCITKIKYHPEKAGWDSFAWKEKYAMEEIR